MDNAKIHFDYTINAGNIITLICLVIGSIIAYSSLTAQSAQNTDSINEIKSKINRLPSDYVNRSEFIQQEARLSRIESKLDRIIEIQLKSGN